MKALSRRTLGRITGGMVAAGALTTGPVGPVRAQSVLKVGLIPSEDSRAMLAQSKDILDALEKNLGMKVQGFVATDYNGVIEALRAKHLDIAYLGPFSYVLATTVTPVEAFVIAETAKSGRTYYHSQIIALKSSGIKKLEDLKGKNFAFVDPASTSGYAFPLAGLLKAGIEPKRDFKTVCSSPARMMPTRSPSPTARSMPPPSPIASSMPPSPRATSRPTRSRWCGARLRFPNRRWCGARTCRPSSRPR